jgi:MFS transporter, ACS family, D-galactonate transporter
MPTPSRAPDTGPTAPDPSATALLSLTSARRWTIVALLFTASVINYFDRATIAFALPLISHDLGLGPETKGVLLSAFFWSYALMQIPIGWCADRFNLRWVYAGAFALWSFAQGLTGLASSLGMLIGFRILLGIGESIYLPGGTKIVSLLFSQSERGLPCGIFDSGTRTGLVMEGILVPWFLEHYGWRMTFVVIGFSALLWVVPWLWATPRRLGGAPAAPGRATPRQAAAEAIRRTGRRTRLAAALWKTGTLARNRNLLGICLGFFCFDYYWYLLLTWLPDYLVTVRHLTILKAGLYAALPYCVFGLSEPIGGWIADRLVGLGMDETRTRKGMIAAAYLTGLLLIPASRVATASTALMLVVGGSLVGLASSNMLVILQACAPPDEVGVWTGIENFFGNVAGITAPLVTGFLIARTHSYTPAFVLAACVLLVGLAAYWFIVGDLRPAGAAATRPQASDDAGVAPAG